MWSLKLIFNNQLEERHYFKNKIDAEKFLIAIKKILENSNLKITASVLLEIPEKES